MIFLRRNRKSACEGPHKVFQDPSLLPPSLRSLSAFSSPEPPGRAALPAPGAPRSRQAVHPLPGSPRHGIAFPPRVLFHRAGAGQRARAPRPGTACTISTTPPRGANSSPKSNVRTSTKDTSGSTIPPWHRDFAVTNRSDIEAEIQRFRKNPGLRRKPTEARLRMGPRTGTPHGPEHLSQRFL